MQCLFCEQVIVQSVTPLFPISESQAGSGSAVGKGASVSRSFSSLLVF